MNENMPNDSILLPEGIVPDDVNVVWLNTAFAEITNGELLKNEKDEVREEENVVDKK